MKDALLIREEYEVLYGFFTEVSSAKKLRGPYSGVAITGHPGIGQLQLHCISPENRLMVMCRQVTVSSLYAPS